MIGPENVRLANKVMTGDDFAFYQEMILGVELSIGIWNKEKGSFQVLMAETEVLKTRMDVHKSKRNIKPKVFDPAISKFFVQLPRKLKTVFRSVQ